MAGRSFAPLARADEGAGAAWRTHFLYSYFREPRLAGIPTTLAVRTEDWKYTVYPESLAPNEELYALGSDPYELTNLAASPEHAERLASLRALLDAELEATAFELPEHARPPVFDAGDELALRVRPALSLEDESGAGREVSASAPPTRATRAGRSALAFEPGAQSLAAAGVDLSNRSFRLRLDVYVEATDALLASHGTEHDRLELRIEGGVPVFDLVARGRKRRVVGAATVVGRWCRLDAGLTPGGRAFLTVDNETRLSPLTVESPGGPAAPLRIGSELDGLLELVELTWTGRQR